MVVCLGNINRTGYIVVLTKVKQHVCRMIAEFSNVNTMLKAASLLILVSIAAAEVTTRCGSKNETTFYKTEGDVEGRYTVEWCSHIPANAQVWNLKLEYTVDNSWNACQANISFYERHRRIMKMRVHSQVDLDITKRSPCNITCLSVPLDLVFTSCYMIVNRIINNKGTTEHAVTYTQTHAPVSSFHRVANKFSSVEAINKLQPIYDIQKNDHDLVVTYNLHYIRITLFGMQTKEYKQNFTTAEMDAISWQNIRENCTVESVTVVCQLQYPAANNCVQLSLKYESPWRNSIKDPSVMVYCSPPSKEVSLDPGMDARIWWAVGALVLVLTLLAAFWAAHTQVLAGVRKKTLQQWMRRYTSYTAEHNTPVSDPGDILLLYARDCEPAMEAVGVLKEMLEEGVPGRVYDLFSESCVAQYAQAPEEWLCGVLARPDVRVVLLQTPAAAALYAAQLAKDTRQMQQPLLGARVQYKAPHYGDVLLQFALRLVRDMAPMQQEYSRYYIATVAELESELLPQVAPYRRYELPAHGARLLADLHLPAPQPLHLRTLAAAVHDLLEYVRANENYLRDELMFI